ncbi:hypothetical protein LTR70_005834 [Exophiala xenobiotica]|uniref:Uncharacterized protein n=1 Tax=Lithohypha guttulata TaxID=1690604 RepID=A0ABR0K8X3_9EURO|nr:hypothetical protein LTR24_005430 [Lithohypha guttulata]KAK5317334.1 hypothetical protein LTR70_005834 [Exophiala xenobiotica]
MPCRKRFQAALQETETTEDGVKMYTWRAVRRQHLRALRKQTRTIVFFMVLIEILRVGVVDMVYAGKHDTRAPGPEEYGIAYSVGYFIAWLYMCFFAVVYVPLFSVRLPALLPSDLAATANTTQWWVPKLSSGDSAPSSGPSKVDKVINLLQKLNMILLPACVGLSLIQHMYHTISVFVYVDARPVSPKIKSTQSLNSRRNWATRALLFSGVCTSMAIGKVSFVILEQLDLAHVKPLEYMIIVLPIQVNMGILLGSLVQFKAEQRRIKKMAAQKAVDAEAAIVDEKQSLLIEA